VIVHLGTDKLNITLLMTESNLLLVGQVVLGMGIWGEKGHGSAETTLETNGHVDSFLELLRSTSL
jgi:hypothetical protein